MNGTFADFSTHNGHLVLGNLSGNNLAIGDYEILARNNGAQSPLYLQQEGGPVRIGNTGPTDMDTRLHITDGEHTSYTSSGYVTIGQTTGTNLNISDYEILARTMRSITTLFTA